MGYNPWGCKELDTTEQRALLLYFTFFKEGNKREKRSVELVEDARCDFSYDTKKLWNSMTLPVLDSF